MTDPDEQMDQRLRETGARWRDALTAGAHPSVAAPPPHRRGLVPAAAAVAVAVVVSVTFAVTRGDDERAPAEPTDSRTPPVAAGAVPWAPLPATGVDIPELTPGPSSDEITATPRCRSADLRAGTQTLMEDGGGSIVLDVDLDLVSEDPCHIPAGPPDVTMVAGGLPIEVQKVHFSGRPEEPVLVTADDPAVVSIGWKARGSCPPAANDRIQVGVSNKGSIGVDVSVPASCHLDRVGSDPWVLPVLSSLGSETASPYLRVGVTGELDVAPEARKPIEFEVTLTSSIDLTLDPCPDFRITTGVDSNVYQLNCAQVSHVDDEGRPYLPAGVPVTFAMEAPFDARVTLVRWVLLAPGSPTFSDEVTSDLPTGTLTGTVTVARGSGSVPVTGGVVQAEGKAGIFTASIGADGSYELELPAGAYKLNVTTSPERSAFNCHDRVGVTGGTKNTADISCLT